MAGKAVCHRKKGTFHVFEQLLHRYNPQNNQWGCAVDCCNANSTAIWFQVPQHGITKVWTRPYKEHPAVFNRQPISEYLNKASSSLAAHSLPLVITTPPISWLRNANWKDADMGTRCANFKCMCMATLSFYKFKCTVRKKHFNQGRARQKHLLKSSRVKSMGCSPKPRDLKCIITIPRQRQPNCIKKIIFKTSQIDRCTYPFLKSSSIQGCFFCGRLDTLFLTQALV